MTARTKKQPKVYVPTLRDVEAAFAHKRRQTMEDVERLGAETQARKISLTLKEPPSANRWHRNVNGRTILSKAARGYTDYVAATCVMNLVRKIAAPTPVAVLIEWHRARKSGDLDKRLGVLLDALQGSAYDNDSQIVRIVAERRDSERKGEVDVTVLEAI